jgi:hypothetical protein
VIVGRTRTGRVTVDVLGINEPNRVRLRQIVIANGEWPDD